MLRQEKVLESLSQSAMNGFAVIELSIATDIWWSQEGFA